MRMLKNWSSVTVVIGVAVAVSPDVVAETTDLLGSTVTASAVFQGISDAEVSQINFARAETIDANLVEFNRPPRDIVTPPDDVTDIFPGVFDFGADFLEVTVGAPQFGEFGPFRSTQIGPSIQNSVVFTVVSANPDETIELSDATIDFDLTTLELRASDVVASGNQISINFAEGLVVSSSDFARIDFSVNGTSPVLPEIPTTPVSPTTPGGPGSPEPSEPLVGPTPTAAAAGMGMLGLLGRRRRQGNQR